MDVYKKIMQNVTSTDPKWVEEVCKKFIEKEFTIKDLGISHKWITHWEKEGLLLNPKTEVSQGWRKFDTVEFVWLRLIVELRKFKIPLEQIKKLKFITEPIPKDILPIFNIIFIVLEGESKLSPSEFKSFKESFLNSTFLRMLLLDSVLFKHNYSMLIDLEGNFIPIQEEYLIENLKNDFYLNFFRKNHISISLSKIILDLFSASTNESLLTKYKLISIEQKKILDLIDNPNLTRVDITYKNNKIDALKTTEYKFIDIRSRIIENIKKNSYQKLEIFTKKGSVVFAEQTISHKI